MSDSVLSLTWREIREHAVNACEQTSEAVDGFFHFATAANRRLCARVEVAELEVTDHQLVVPAGKDRIALPHENYAIHDVWNLTDSQSVEPEEDDLYGRSRFLTDSGRPESGTVHRYVRSGRWLLLRDTASAQTTLSVSYKRVPPDVVKDRLDDHPITPPHLDWPLIWMTAAVYYTTHPVRDPEVLQAAGGDPARIYSDFAWQGAVVEPKQPKAYETRNRRHRLSTGPSYSTRGFTR